MGDLVDAADTENAADTTMQWIQQNTVNGVMEQPH